MRQIGSVTLGRAKNSGELGRLLEGRLPESETYIVKPSWYSPHPANYTDAEALGMLLDCLDGDVIVTEGYTMDRHDGSMEFTVGGEKVDWRWIMEHPDWGWAREEGRWDEFRRQDGWFLDEHGFTDLFQEHGAEYVNVTEEIWRGRIVDPGLVRGEVESRFGPALREKIYGFMPERLHRHRGSTLISLGKVKGYGGAFPSLTLKNMFGLIPDPTRSWWHGPKDRDLSRSIIDITKLYASFFTLYGVCEAFSSMTVSDSEGEVKVPWGSYRVVRDLGFVAHSPDLVSLDAVLCGLISVDPGKVGYLELGSGEFGPYDKSCVEEAREVASYWFPVD